MRLLRQLQVVVRSGAMLCPTKANKAPKGRKRSDAVG